MSLGTLLVEWSGLGLRWLHVTAAIVWIGTFLYFMALDQRLKGRGPPAEGPGEAWQVHGGGFYRVRRRPPSRGELALTGRPTWFRWEAYATWLSGFALLALVYYGDARADLIDPAVVALTPAQAAAAGTASLLGGYVAYEALCRLPLGRDDRVLAAAVFVLLVAAAWGYARLFGGRGALVHAGALMGTIMVANVAHVVVPHQRRMVAALAAGRPPDPRLERQARQRSLHIHHLALSVVFLMLANHHPAAFPASWTWLVVAVALIAGAAVRRFLDGRHQGVLQPAAAG